MAPPLPSEDSQDMNVEDSITVIDHKNYIISENMIQYYLSCIYNNQYMILYIDIQIYKYTNIQIYQYRNIVYFMILTI